MNYILGTGIAGLILGIKNPDYQLIGMDEGQTAGKYSLGPRIIQYSPGTEKFLQDLGLETKIRQVYIGYEKDGLVHLHLNDINNFREDYSLFTRGKKEFEPSFLSGGQNAIDVICIADKNYQDSFMYLSKFLYDKLNTEGRIIKSEILDIDIDTKNIRITGKDLHYSKIISTLSQRIFQRIAEPFLETSQLNLKFKNFLVLESTEKLQQFYTYSLKDYSRRTFFNGYQVLEIPDNVYFESIQDIYSLNGDDLKVLSKISFPVQIVDSLKIRQHPIDESITFRGRYAEWDHSILINKLIET